MGKFTFVAEEHFGELVTYGCNQMAKELWEESRGTKIDAIRFAEILELQAAHIREYMYQEEETTMFLQAQHKKNGIELWPFTVKAYQDHFKVDSFNAHHIVKTFYKRNFDAYIE